MENTEKQNEVLQEVKTEQEAVEQKVEQKQEAPKIQAKVVKSEGGNLKVKLKKKNEPVQEQSTDELPVRNEPEASKKVSEENKEEQVEKPAEKGEEEKATRSPWLTTTAC